MQDYRTLATSQTLPYQTSQADQPAIYSSDLKYPATEGYINSTSSSQPTAQPYTSTLENYKTNEPLISSAINDISKYLETYQPSSANQTQGYDINIQTQTYAYPSAKDTQSHTSYLYPSGQTKPTEILLSNYDTNYSSTAYASNYSQPLSHYASAGDKATDNYSSVGGDQNYGDYLLSGNITQTRGTGEAYEFGNNQVLSSQSQVLPTQVERVYQSVPKTPEKFGADRQYMSSPGTRSIKEPILSPYRKTMYKEFDEIVEDLPDRTHLLAVINTTLKKSPAHEKLLAPPLKVSITRISDLQPARIYVETPLHEKYEDGSVYEGESRNGKRNGKGKVYYQDGKRFEGEFINGKIEGHGRLSFKNGNLAYEGTYDDNLFHGEGKLYNEYPEPKKDSFNYKDFQTLENSWLRDEGDFRKGKKNGIGTLYLVGGEKYYGEFKDDQIHGKGNFYLKEESDGIAGEWRNNKFVEKFWNPKHF